MTFNSPWVYISGTCLGIVLFSALYFSFNHDWIIINFPQRRSKSIITENQEKQVTKKRVKRIYWNNDAWHNEETELLWSENKAETLMHLITSWLTLLDEEKVMEKKVSLQSVVPSPSGIEAYISFDRNPFTKNQSTFAKFMWLEGLLKTIRESGISIQGIYFLVHHQPLTDFHLDFSNAWPISGFSEA